MIKPVPRVLLTLLLLPMAALGVEPDEDRQSEPVMPLARGICVDRQVRTIPPEVGMRIGRDDIRLIKSMGFEFVKLLVNPEVVKAGDRLDGAAFTYFDEVLELAASEKLPVVVCVHPEDGFKRKVLGTYGEFDPFSGFMADLARHLGKRWTPSQVALQIMTEPYGTSADPADWNHWDRLQHRLWKTVRGEMPGHALILSGDLIGSLEGLDNIQPVDDDRVLYSFTFYEPHLFTWQGGTWREGVIPRLKNLPYPSGSATLTDLPRLLATMPETLRAEAATEIERYAAQRWDRDALAARIDKAAAWRTRHGGRVKLWCAEFGCYQAAVNPADRCRYLDDMRSVLEEREIGWACWSYNETFTVMTPESRPFGPPLSQTPDRAVLKVLLPDRDPGP